MKRGASGLSLVVPVRKPAAMTSHDVVNRVRRIFGERRVGHTGTLDPLATGVLPICIGPATRLERYLGGHDKRYRVTMRFGSETTTDDSLGEPTVTGDVPRDLLEGSFARSYVEGLVGKHLQVPPRYSAIKKNGKKAYELARAGQDAELGPRPIEVFESCLVGCGQADDVLSWTIDFSVSKGTYIRALVRDMGRELGCPAHVCALERLEAGAITLDDCVSLETLEDIGVAAAVDPVRLLGFKVVFADGQEKLVRSGARLAAGKARVYLPGTPAGGMARCSCAGSLVEHPDGLEDGELVSVVLANRLEGVYAFDASAGYLKPDCIFSIGVLRG